MFDLNQPFQWKKCLSALPSRHAGQYVYLITQQEKDYIFKGLTQNAKENIKENFKHELFAYQQFKTQKFCSEYQIYTSSDIINIHSPMAFFDEILVLPYYQTLNTALNQQFSTAQKIQIFKEICLSVQSLHKLGFVHGDLKLDHIALSNPIKLLDLAQISQFHTVTKQVEISATPAYMAPELFIGESISIQSDIYALGIIFYLLFIGNKPFNAKNYQDWAIQHCQIEIPLLPLEYSLYQNILDGMLAKQQKNRFSNLQTLISALNLIKKT